MSNLDAIEQPPQIENKSRSVSILAKEAFISYAGKFLGKGVLAIVQIILARLLGPALFGVYTLGWSFLKIGSAIGVMGTEKGVIYFGARFWGKDTPAVQRIILKSLLMVIVTSGIFTVALFVAAPSIETLFEEENLAQILRIFAFGFPFWTATIVIAASTRISKNTRNSVIIEEIAFPLSFLILILIPTFIDNQNLQFFAGMHISSFIITIFIGGWILVKMLKASSSTEAGIEKEPTTADIFKYSFPTGLAGMFFVLTNWGNRLLVGFFRTSEEVGVFQAAVQLTIILTVTMISMDSILSPMFAEAHHKNDKKGLEETYRVGTKWGLYISIPIFLGVVFSAEQILTFVYKDAYAVGGNALIILAVTQLFNITTGAVGVVIVMTGHQNKWLWMTIVMFFVNLGLNVVLIPMMGIEGAAIATGISIAVLYSIGLFVLRRYLEIWPYDSRFIKLLTSTVFSILLLFFVNQMLNTFLLVEILVNFILGTIVFVGIVWLFGFDAEDKQIFNQLVKRLRAESSE